MQEEPWPRRHQPPGNPLHIRLGAEQDCGANQGPHGAYPRQWKTARGVAIPKPGNDCYGLAKPYRVISPLNCLGKMVEKVAAMLVSTHCEATGCFHPGQYGCRTRQSAASTPSTTTRIARECQGSSVAPTMGDPPCSLWPHDVVVWIHSSAQVSVHDAGSLGGVRRGRGEADPKTIGVSSLRPQTQLSAMSREHHGVDDYADNHEPATSTQTTESLAPNA